MESHVRARTAIFALLALVGGLLPVVASQGRPPDRQALLEEYNNRARKVGRTDVEGHYQLAVWCADNGLETQATRHLTRVIGLDPNHKEARLRLGHVFHEGKWMTKAERDKAEEEAEAARYAAKGLVRYKGEWVPKADVAKLKAGFERVDGELVSPEDAKAMRAGMVRHPETWEWIKKEDLDKAHRGMFLVDGKWVSSQEADRIRSNWASAWKITTRNYVLTTNLPWEKAGPLRHELNGTYMRLRNIFQGVEPTRAERMNVYVFATLGDYNSYNSQYPGHYSAVSGGWFSIADPAQPAVCFWDDNFGRINLPHALALQYQTFVFAEAGFRDMPYWFVAGVATYCDRFWDASLRKWGCENIVTHGGLATYDRRWFASFQISIDHIDASQKNLRDAGFLICYTLDGGDEKAFDLWKGFWSAFKEAKKPNELIQYVTQLQTHLTQSNEAIRKYFQSVLTGR